MPDHPAHYRLGTARIGNDAVAVIETKTGIHRLATALAPLLATLPDRTTDARAVPASLLDLLDRWDAWQAILRRAADGPAPAGSPLDAASLTWLPPILFPRKLICIGTNYRDHMREMGITTDPEWPYAFLKPATNTMVGSGSAVRIPANTRMVDWEVELAVVIGRHARDIAAAEAPAHIAGYSVFNDLSARDWLARRPPVGIDWVLHKAFDGFAPMGPWITPAECAGDPRNLDLALTVNGITRQASNTARMVFDVYETVAHLSRVMTLEPGDVIATGTPAGVGFGQNPQIFLKPGDRIVASIQGLGTLETLMV